MHQTDEGEDLWVFAYGSLLWNPGFPHSERRPARVRGYHRSLCVYSHVHRGTPERPGLVFGLDRGGACRGLAYRISASDRQPAMEYLRAREQVTPIYIEARLMTELDGGRRVSAIAYVVDRKHPQYSGRLSVDAMLNYVQGGTGRSGGNIEYVLASHGKLQELGIRDPALDALVNRISR
jgi:glutathione-specific gamma-glutamylcyclotransferase